MRKIRIIKGKRGWIRIAEAFLAVMLIAGVLLFIYTRTFDGTEKTNAIYNLEVTILDEIENNEEYRSHVLSGNEGSIKSIIKPKIPSYFKFDVKICNLKEVCNLGEYQEEVYVKERVISSTLDKYSPKVIKIFIWEEE